MNFGTMLRAAAILSVILGLSMTQTWAKPGAPSVTHTEKGETKVGQKVPAYNSFYSVTDANWSLHRMLRKNKDTKAHKGYVLTFFRTDCAPCIRGMDELKENASRLKQAGIQTIFINYMEKPASTEMWVTERGYHKLFRIAYDKYGYSGPVYGINKSPKEDAVLPLTVVLDGAGTVKKIITEEGPDYISLLLKSI